MTSASWSTVGAAAPTTTPTVPGSGNGGRHALKIGTPCCSYPAGRNLVTWPQPARREAGKVALLLGSHMPARAHGSGTKRAWTLGTPAVSAVFPVIYFLSLLFSSQHVPLEVWFVSTGALIPLIPFNTSWPSQVVDPRAAGGLCVGEG